MSTAAIAARLTDAARIREFLDAGQAKFTLVSRTTGNRFTYRAKPGKAPDLLFFDMLIGADNTNDYRYIGYWGPRGFRPADHTPGPGALALAWFMGALAAPTSGKLDQVEFWHAGRCAKCGRLLTTPESIARGLGPTCATK